MGSPVTDAAEDEPDARGRVASATAAAYLGVMGYVGFVVWLAVLRRALAAAGVDPGPSAAQVVGVLALGLGTGTVAFFYVRWTDRDWSYVDVAPLDRRDVAYAVGGVVAIFGVLGAINLLTSALGVQTTDHGVVRAARSAPEVLLVLVPASWLVVAPGEELLYRNVVQKSLYGAFTRTGAIMLATALFAAIHLPAYASPGASPTALAVTLATVFWLALVLGVVYDRTRNLVVSAFVHGTYNAVTYAAVYVQIT